MSSSRIFKINEVIKDEVSQLVFKELEADTGILTITAVETSPATSTKR